MWVAALKLGGAVFGPVARFFWKPSNRYLLLQAGIVAAAAWAFSWQHDQLEDARAAADTAADRAEAQEARADGLEKTLEAERRTHAREIEAVRQAVEEERARAQRAQELLERIQAAPPEDDGPIAPVLRDTLDALRGGEE
ncbi:hypothetical protein DLJ49_18725 [Rhodovulum sp. 12E13]|uniref:hypothetical protein n=1 Tax=Rhodovulum sp. 12E13 TaxID=2203891 RepID=UPI000E133156|nr:hypothetical protein [Rhodovulum sp. 12E13]RDC69674.1 hypothetical protein DLJ49_18725 [Rhodovulum sp. 12E13]